ncbi:MAG: glutamate--tRNA ligase family protein, partial [Phycicoccus sp.]
VEPPRFAHLPLLRNPDKSKISKRTNPAARLTWFREQGYLPEALVNFLALLAYPPATGPDGEDVEVFTVEEFSARFDWGEVNPVGPVFDVKKLDWLNGVHIRALESGELASRLLPFLIAEGVLGDDPTLGELARLKQVAALIQTRIAHLTEATDLVAPFYIGDDALEVADDARAQLSDDAPRTLDAAFAALSALSDHRSGVLGSETAWDAAAIEAALRGALVDGLGLKPKFAFGPLRTAVSGRRVSPPLFESMEILGRDATLARLTRLRATL